MKIDNNYLQFRKNKSFKKGLTSYEINTVKNLTYNDCENILNRIRNQYGVRTNLIGSKTVAYCLEQTIKIMSRAGFQLPQNFVFGPEEKGTLGTYCPSTDTVLINSNYNEFYNIEEQNKMEEGHGSFHPDTKHFLSTYLHEFSHAAHYKNLCNNFGIAKAYAIFMREMPKYSPGDIILGPINSILKTNFPKFASSLIQELFPPEIGMYSKTEISEYFAEYNSRELSLLLGDNFIINNIPTNFSSNYIGHSDNDSFNDEENTFKAIKSMLSAAKTARFIIPGMSIGMRIGTNITLTNFFENCINRINGDIWNGDIKSLKEKSFLYNKNSI